LQVLAAHISPVFLFTQTSFDGRAIISTGMVSIIRIRMDFNDNRIGGCMYCSVNESYSGNIEKKFTMFRFIELKIFCLMKIKAILKFIR